MASGEPILGSVDLWVTTWAPRGWALCSGQLLSIAQNTALFSILGTTFGGDGRTTFGLPDMRGRVPVGMGQGPGLSDYVLGQRGGTEQVTLTLANLASHTHTATGTVVANDGGASQPSPKNNFIASLRGQNIFSDTSNTNMAQNSVAVTVQTAGGNIPFSIVQPYLVLNYIIALEGIFPSRN